MNTKRHYRITALLLSIVMLLPLLVLPSFAEDGTKGMLWQESFDGKTVAETTTGSPISSKITEAAADADAHGDVFQIDVKGMGRAAYYLWKDKNTFWELTDVTVADGRVTGKGNGATWSGTLNSENGNPSVAVDTKDGAAYTDGGYYIVTGAFADAVGGAGNIANAAIFKNPAVLSEKVSTLALSMDLYFAPGTTNTSGISSRFYANTADGTKSMELFEIYAYDTYVKFLRHENGKYVGQESTFTAPTGKWITLTILIDTATAVRTVYVNGEFMTKMTNATPLSTAVSPNASGLNFQIDRGNVPSALSGFVQVDNVTLTSGELMELPAFENTYYYNDFEIYEGAEQADFQKYFKENGASTYTHLATSARPFTEADGNTSLKLDFLYGEGNEGNNNVPHPLSIPTLSYTEAEKVYFESKYYIEPNSKGTIENQIYCYLNNGSASSWINFFRIDSSTGALLSPSSTSGAYLTIGEWNTVGVIYNMVNGDAELYLNGMYVKTHNTGKTNVTFCRNATNTESSGGWIVAKVMTQKTPSSSNLAGSFMVDDCRMMTLDALPAEYGYLYYNSFGTTKNNTAPTAGITSIAASNTAVTNEYASNAWRVDYKVQSTSAAVDGDLNRDKNPRFKNPALSYQTTPSIVIEADYFIEPDARGQLQSQIYSLTHNGATTNPNTGKTDNTYVDLYQIRYTDPTQGALLRIENSEKWGTARLSLGAWNKISVVIDMVAAQKEVYLNGALVAFSPLKPIYDYWTNIEVGEGQLIVGKVNKLVGEGTFHVDNIAVFAGTAPSVAPETGTVADFEEFDLVIGESVLGSADFVSVPALATYVATATGTAVRLDMGPAKGSDEYALIARNASSRPVVKWDLTWDPANPTEGSLDGSALTFTEDAKLPGKYYTVIDSLNYYAVTAGEAELIYNGGNVGASFKANHEAISYDSSKYAVLEADYFIEKNSVGTIESQGEGFYSGETKVSYVNLFTIDMASGRLDGSSAYLEIGKWNNVKSIIDLESGIITLYVNGVWAKQKASGSTNMTVTADAWSVAKVQRQSSAIPSPVINRGGLQIDNVDVSALETVPASSVSDKFLSDADFNAYMDELLVGVNGASIRLSNPTGLRFATRVNVDRLAYLEKLFGENCVVDMGTLIAPATYLDPANANGNTNGIFTKEALEALPYTNKYVDVKFGGVYFKGDAGMNTEDGNYMVGSIVNFKEGNIAREYAGIGYVTVQIGDTAVTVYGDACVRSAKQVAQAALADDRIDWAASGYAELLNAYATYGE